MVSPAWIALIIVGIMASCLYQQITCCDDYTFDDRGCGCSHCASDCIYICHDFRGCVCDLCGVVADVCSGCCPDCCCNCCSNELCALLDCSLDYVNNV